MTLSSRTAPQETRLLGLDGSPTGHGKTDAAVRRVLEETGHAYDVVSLCELRNGTRTLAEILSDVEQADGFVIGSSVMKGTYSATLKELFDGAPSGRQEGSSSPFSGKAATIVITGAAPAHFLAIQDLRNLLVTNFATHVLPPGIFLTSKAFGENRELLQPYEELLVRTGRALSEYMAFLSESVSAAKLVPQY